jgi:hypothetical protein
MEEVILNKTRKSLLNTKVEAITWDGGVPLINFGRSRLSIVCVWRLVNNGDFIIASSDSEGIEEEKEEEVQNILYGKSVERVSVQPPFHDLKIEFSEGILLETFSTSCKYSNWYLLGGEHENDMIIAGPHSSWSVF